MTEDTEMKVLREEFTAKIANSVLSEKIDYKITKFDVASNVISILFRLFTVIFNGYLAYEYYKKGELLYFKLTLCFIIIPACISILLSITL